MKTVMRVMLSWVALSVIADTILAQGTIFFANGWPTAGPQQYSSVNAPVYDVDGVTPLAGAGFLAELYGGAPGNSLEPIPASITPFSTGARGYFFNSSDVSVPGTSPGGTAVAEVRVWRASDGATFEQADKPGGHIGISAMITAHPLGGGSGVPNPGALLVGLQGFSLFEVVPEPSVLMLGLFASLGIAFGRGVRRR